MKKHIKQVEHSHGFATGDTVTRTRGSMSGKIMSILASSLFSNGGVPMAKVKWESGETSRHTLTQLKHKE